MTRIVVPFGFYGAGNIGDEATLNGFAALLRLSGLRAKASVASRNPAHTAHAEPAFRYFHGSGRDWRRSWAMQRATAHAMVGGTPIMDVEGEWPLNELTPLVRSIDQWKVPLAFIGIGTETLRTDKSRRLVAEEIAPRADYWTVRCDRDRQRLIEYGVPPEKVTAAADMAWLIEPSGTEYGRDRFREWGIDAARPPIGVNLVNENALFELQPQIVDELAAGLDELSGRMNAQVLFLSNEVREDANFDKASAQQVIGRMKHPERAVLAPNLYLTPREMMSVIAGCAMTISMRYHFCIFSAHQRVPFFAIERSDKIADLCWDLDWRGRAQPVGVTTQALRAWGDTFEQEQNELRAQLATHAGAMKQRAMKNLSALEVLAGTQGAPLASLVGAAK
jgi:polysaccharide pyruvyl transferase WcaK-like protein